MFVYIIYSLNLNSYYIGYCKDMLDDRIHKHQLGFYDSSYTKKASDWVLVWHLKCHNTKQALAIEKHIKRMKSKIYIQNLLKYKELGEKLLKKYE